MNKNLTPLQLLIAKAEGSVNHPKLLESKHPIVCGIPERTHKEQAE